MIAEVLYVKCLAITLRKWKIGAKLGRNHRILTSEERNLSFPAQKAETILESFTSDAEPCLKTSISLPSASSHLLLLTVGLLLMTDETIDSV